MKYISTLREGERINEIFLCKSKQTAMTKSGKPYDNVILQDKTGTLDAKIWDVGSVGIEEFDAMDYIAITGDITSFQGNLQCSIKRARKVNEGEYDPADYLPVSDKDVEVMYKELMGFIGSVKNQTCHSSYIAFLTIRSLSAVSSSIQPQRACTTAL